MAYYYAISTGGWYDTNFANYTLPEDAIELTEEQWTTLRLNMNNGQILVLNEESELEWQDPPPPPVEDGRVVKRTEFRMRCADQIERSSFSSDALGAIHNYDCRVVDQINLKIRYDVASYNDSPEPIWASDGTRYEWTDHTAAQLIEVMIDMNAHIKTSQLKLAQKLAAVDAATTYAAVMALTWD